MKNGDGRVIPGAIPVVYFTTEERLNEMIAYCRAIGVFVANPHVNNVEGGGRFRADNIQLLAKQRYDPKGLLNPGKMITLSPKPRRQRDSMKTWIPDARNFAYLNWKQVDALPREIDAAGAADGGDRAARPSSAAGDRHADQQSAARARAREDCRRSCPSMRCRRSATARATSTRLSRNALGERARRSWPWCATWARALRSAGFQKARALQHARRQHIADRRDGARSARGVRPAHFCAVRLGRRDALRA